MIRRRPPLALVGLLAALCAPAAAAGDRIVVQGDTLRGEVTQLKAEGVVIDLVYGTGTITVPWREIEDIETQGPRTILYGEQGEVEGRILGLDEDGRLLVGEERESARPVGTDSILASHGPDDPLLQRLRSRFRLWKASLDAGAAFTDATTDQVSGHAGLRIERRGDRTSWLLEGSVRYAQDTAEVEVERPPGSGDFVETDETTVTENIGTGFTRGEYDLTERSFAFASALAVHDAVQELALRLEPKAGLGFRLIQRERVKLSTDIGGAYVYENFFGSEENESVSVAFGAQAEAQLPYGAIWRARAEYLPAVDDWTENYLIRGHTEVDFPLHEWLSFVVRAEDEYDNTPAEDTERNRFTSALVLRARFP